MPELPEAERARQTLASVAGPADRGGRRQRHLRLPSPSARRDRFGARRPRVRERASAREVPLAGDRGRSHARPASRDGRRDRARSRPATADLESLHGRVRGRHAASCSGTVAGSGGRCSTPTSATSARMPPLSAATEFRRLVGAGRTAVKARLLNQGAISGVGNLLADQALWQARLAPQRLTPSSQPRISTACAASCARPSARRSATVACTRGASSRCAAATERVRAAATTSSGRPSAGAPRTGARPARSRHAAAFVARGRDRASARAAVLCR